MTWNDNSCDCSGSLTQVFTKLMSLVEIMKQEEKQEFFGCSQRWFHSDKPRSSTQIMLKFYYHFFTPQTFAVVSIPKNYFATKISHHFPSYLISRRDIFPNYSTLYSTFLLSVMYMKHKLHRVVGYVKSMEKVGRDTYNSGNGYRKS